MGGAWEYIRQVRRVKEAGQEMINGGNTNKRGEGWQYRIGIEHGGK
jgi:hypothetical protein